jgi:thiosulfate dehydrogenase [quinone] large subunit
MTLLESPIGATRATTKPATALNRPGTEGLADTTTTMTTKEMMAARYAFAVARIGIGFVFLWAFADKLFGLDHATPAARAWVNGGSPSGGFLKGVHGPFAGAFNAIAGAPADWLFMAGLLGIGVALVLGVGMRIAAAAGALLLVLMWAASLPIATNPFLDDHLIYAVVLVGLALMHSGGTAGLGQIWDRLPIVRRIPALR